MRLLFVANIVVVVVVVIVAVVVALLVVTDHTIHMNVVLRLTEAAVEFVWWWGLQSNFCIQPNKCVVVGVVTIEGMRK